MVSLQVSLQNPPFLSPEKVVLAPHSSPKPIETYVRIELLHVGPLDGITACRSDGRKTNLLC